MAHKAEFDIDEEFVPDIQTIPPVTWNTRRRMALIALWSFIFGTLITLGIGVQPWPDRTMELIETIYTYFAICCVTVIGAYMGSTSIPYLGKGIRRGD